VAPAREGGGRVAGEGQEEPGPGNAGLAAAVAQRNWTGGGGAPDEEETTRGGGAVAVAIPWRCRAGSRSRIVLCLDSAPSDAVRTNPKAPPEE
jgi:hypothetical protein